MNAALKRATHPLAARYVSTAEEMSVLLDRLPSQVRSQLPPAMTRLAGAVAGRGSLEGALAAAGRTSLEGIDPEVAVFFFSLWVQACVRSGRLDEMRLVARRAGTLPVDRMPPEIRAHAVSVFEAAVAAAEGDPARREAASRRAIRLLSPGSPRRPVHLLALAAALARQGKGGDLWEDPEWTRVLGKLARGKVAAVRFMDAAERGEASEAEAALAEAQADPSAVAALGGALTNYRILLDLTRGAWQPEPVKDISPPWAVALHRLLAGFPGDALDEVRRAIAAGGERRASLDFDPFALLRAELAAGNLRAAERILAERRAAGWTHPLLDFFEARRFRLAGDLDAAARTLSAAIRAAGRRRAQGRLSFEMEMACEMSREDAFGLGRLAERILSASGRDARAEAAAPVPAAPRPASPGVIRILGKSPAIAAVRETVRRFAPLAIPVLVTGPTGSGKELVARALHEASPRAAEPFVAVNCGAIPDSLLESELFGHERGAFTGADREHKGLFEEAGSGTLFLDEIGEIPARLQVALLRVLESGEIRRVGGTRTRQAACRVVAATNADLDARARAGTFRNDLVFRLRRLEIRLPALSARRGDIPILARHFLDAGRPDGVRAEITPALAEALASRAWPGNVRELKSVIERMRILGSEKLAWDLADLHGTGAPGGAPAEDDGTRLIREGRSGLRRMERLKDLFRRHGTLTRVEITQVLGISTATATRDLRRLLAGRFVERVEPTASPRTHYFRVISRS